ncbi:MAG TPA: hypothetical protein VEB21_14400, partial [Terriglobales bacterium]|nr:hypothetical protein [Terriglobales bacterium]
MSQTYDGGQIRVTIAGSDQTAAAFANAQRSIQQFEQKTDAAMGGLRQKADRARDSLDILGDAIGLKVGREMKGLIASAPVLSSALSAAFSGAAVVGFIGIATQIPGIIQNITSELAGWGEAERTHFDKMGQEYSRFVEKLKELHRLQRQVELAKIADPAQRARLEQAYAKQDAAALRTELDNARTALSEFNTETERQRKSGFYGGEMYFASRQKQADELSLRVGMLAADVQIFETKAEDAGTRAEQSFGKAADTIRTKTSAELDNLIGKLDSFGDKIRNLMAREQDPFEKLRDDIMAARAEAESLRGSFVAIFGMQNLTLNKAISDLDQQLAVVQGRIGSITSSALFESTTKTANQWADRISNEMRGQAGAMISPDQRQKKFLQYSEIIASNWEKSHPQLAKLAEVSRDFEGAFSNMFQSIALGTRDISQVWQAAASSITAAIGQIIAKMLYMAVIQKAIGAIFGAFMPTPAPTASMMAGT